jgi:hypothetical protein
MERRMKKMMKPIEITKVYEMDAEDLHHAIGKILGIKENVTYIHKHSRVEGAVLKDFYKIESTEVIQNEV